jgi:hypothetical protein
MTPRASRGWWLAVAAISSAAVGCSSDTHPTAPLSARTSAALAVANTFQKMGDSVVAERGDSSEANRYYGAAAVLRRVPVFDTITIMVDSVPMTFNAVALAVDDTGGAAACPMPPMDDDQDAQYDCPWGAPRMSRTLFAWQSDSLPHIVQLVAMSDSGAVGLPTLSERQHHDSTTDSSSASAGIPARLKYFAKGSGIWWGTAGYQHNAVTPNGQACPTPSDSAAAADTTSHGDREGHGWGQFHMTNANCQMAAFTFDFAATVSVPPVDWWHRNSASGTHTISLAASQVPGAYVTLSAPMAGGH